MDLFEFGTTQETTTDTTLTLSTTMQPTTINVTTKRSFMDTVFDLLNLQSPAKTTVVTPIARTYPETTYPDTTVSLGTATTIGVTVATVTSTPLSALVIPEMAIINNAPNTTVVIETTVQSAITTTAGSVTNVTIVPSPFEFNEKDLSFITYTPISNTTSYINTTGTPTTVTEATIGQINVISSVTYTATTVPATTVGNETTIMNVTTTTTTTTLITVTTTTTTTTTTTPIVIPDAMLSFQTISFASYHERFYEKKDMQKRVTETGNRFETYIGDFSSNWTHPWPIDKNFPLKEPKADFNWCFVIYNDLLHVGDETGLWRVTWNETWISITDDLKLELSDYYEVSEEDYELAEYLDKEIDTELPWTTLTKNITELNCVVHQKELWICGLFEGKTCVAFDSEYNMTKRLETKVARSSFGMVSVGKRLVLVGGQIRDTTLGGLGLYDNVGYVSNRSRRDKSNSVQDFLDVRLNFLCSQNFM